MKPDGTMLVILTLNAMNVAWLIGSGEIWFIVKMLMEILQ